MHGSVMHGSVRELNPVSSAPGVPTDTRACTGILREVDPRLRLAALLVYAAAVSSLRPGPSMWARAGAYAVLLVAVVAASGVPAGWVLERASLVVPLSLGIIAAHVLARHLSGDNDFAVALLSPKVYQAGAGTSPALRPAVLPLVEVGGLLLLRAVLAASFCAAIIGSTGIPRMLWALEKLRVPRLLVYTLGFTLRYISVLVEETSRARTALISRGAGVRRRDWPGLIGKIAGGLFLRTCRRGERVNMAVIARASSLEGLRWYTGAELAGVSTRDVIIFVIFTGTVVGTSLVL